MSTWPERVQRTPEGLHSFFFAPSLTVVARTVHQEILIAKASPGERCSRGRLIDGIFGDSRQRTKKRP